MATYEAMNATLMSKHSLTAALVEVASELSKRESVPEGRSVGHDAVLNGVLQGEDTSLGLSLVSDIGILLSGPCRP